MRELGTVLVAALAAALAGCGGPGPVTEAEASRVADETQTAWASMNSPAIESRYGKTVVAFDPAEPSMITSWGQFSNLKRAFSLKGYDGIEVKDRRIQLLGEDGFVVTGVAGLRSSSDPAKNVTVRFSNVYQRAEDGMGFSIINEVLAPVPDASDGGKPAQATPASSPASPSR